MCTSDGEGIETDSEREKKRGGGYVREGERVEVEGKENMGWTGRGEKGQRKVAG